MDRAISYLTFNPEQFQRLSRRRRVLLSQLPLTMTAVVLLIAGGLLRPELVQEPLLQLSMLMHAVLLVLCAVLPWKRLPEAAPLAIPVLEFVPIALMREGAGSEFTALGFLAVFPIIWLASSRLRQVTVILIGALASLAVVWVPLFVSGRPVTAEELTRPMLLPIMIVAIGITVSAITSVLFSQQVTLKSKDAELRALLEASALRERLLHTVVNAVDVGVLALDPSGNEILANNKHRSNAPTGCAITAESGLSMFHKDGVTALEPSQGPVHRAVAGETFTDEIIRVGSAASQKTLSVSASRMTSDDGRDDGAVVTFSDVTELMAALNAKQAFIANITHELRTPLTSIVGYVEMLAGTSGASPQVTSGLNVVSRNAHRLLGLVEDLLGTASGPTELAPAPTEFIQIVLQSMASAVPRAIEAGIVLDSDVEEDLKVVCDPGKIGQVLDNLISNAIKYSPGGGNITVRAWKDGENVHCSVSDTGMGMNSEDSSNVFSRFFRSSAALRAAIPGVGLGLAIVQEIIEQHSGLIECRSVLGEGTTFTFSLPLAQPSDGGR